MANVQLKANSAAIVNAVIDGSQTSYTQRIPKVTRANVAEVVERIISNRVDWNIFANTLMDGLVRDLFVEMVWNNPLGVLKQSVPNRGSWIREIGFPLLTGKEYDVDSVDVFSNDPPNVLTAHHSVNRKQKYKVTLNEDLLRMALWEDPENGFSRFIQQTVNRLYASDEVDEFLIMKEVIKNYYDSGTGWREHVEDITTAAFADKAEIGHDIAQKIRQKAGEFALPDSRFTASGIVNPKTSPDDLVLISTPAVTSNLDVNVLAMAFNLVRADPSFLAGRTINISPIDTKSGDQIVAILADKEWFVAADLQTVNSQIINPATLSYNSWLHRWGIYSASPFRNVCFFTTGATSTISITPSTVTAVAVVTASGDPATVGVGGSLQLTATVTGTGLFDKGVLWELVSDDGSISSPQTHVTNEGVLFVGTDEDSTSFVVKATSLEDNTKTATLEVTVS